MCFFYIYMRFLITQTRSPVRHISNPYFSYSRTGPRYWYFRSRSAKGYPSTYWYPSSFASRRTRSITRLAIPFPRYPGAISMQYTAMIRPSAPSSAMYSLLPQSGAYLSFSPALHHPTTWSPSYTKYPLMMPLSMSSFAF